MYRDADREATPSVRYSVMLGALHCMYHTNILMCEMMFNSMYIIANLYIYIYIFTGRGRAREREEGVNRRLCCFV